MNFGFLLLIFLYVMELCFYYDVMLMFDVCLWVFFCLLN